MSVEGLPQDQSGFIRMDAFDATDPDEFRPLPDGGEDAPPRLDDLRLESLLERVLESDADPDDAVLPPGADAPFDEADGAEDAGAWPGSHTGEQGPFGAGGAAEPEHSDEDPAEAHEWPEYEPDFEHGPYHDHQGDGPAAPGHDDDDLDVD
jgi:hypothetical protein